MQKPATYDDDDDDDDGDYDDSPDREVALSTPTWSPVNPAGPTPAPAAAPTPVSAVAWPTEPVPRPFTFPDLLPFIFKPGCSRLPDRQLRAFHSRVQRSVITPEQQQELAVILTHVLSGSESPFWGCEKVVAFMAREAGSEAWASALARGLESVVFDDDEEEQAAV